MQGAAAPALAALPPRARLYGIPVELDEVTSWRSTLPQDRRIPLFGSRRYYTAGGCFSSRLPKVRVAAWAVVGRNGDGWWNRAGPCPGLETIGRAELAAVVHVLLDAELLITRMCVS